MEGITMKQKELARWLRGIVIFGWLGSALLSALIMPALAREAAEANPEFAYLMWPCLGIFWLGMVPVVIALWHAWRIFGEIGRDNSFCEENAIRLRYISLLALADTILCALSAVFLLICNALHPGIFLMLLLIGVIGLGVFVASAALSYLTWKASALKEENDLTI